MVARNTLVLALLSVALLCFAAQSLTAQRLVASYPFSGNASDASGNGHNGTVNGATLTEDRFGNANAAYNFDGINDYISVPHSSAFNFPFTYSISLWVKFCVSRNPNTNADAIINKGPHDAAGYSIQRAPFEKIAFSPYTADLGGTSTTTSNLNDGRWHHFVAVYESTTRDPKREYFSIYLDGVLEDTDDGAAFPTYTNTLNLWIARSIKYPLFYFKGAIDDINIYDTMLTAAQVSALYRANGWPKAAQPNTLNLSIAASDTVICPGKTVQLSLLGNPTEVTWNPSPTLQGPTSMFPTVTPEKTTTYIVKALKIAGAEPCRDTVQKIDSIRITVRQPPKVELGSTRYLCLGDSITIGANASDGTPPYRYQWNPHPLISSRNQLLQTVKVDRSTLFILTVTDREGCIARDTLNVVMLSPPTMNAGADTTICRGGSVLLGGCWSKAFHPSPTAGPQAWDLATPQRARRWPPPTPPPATSLPSQAPTAASGATPSHSPLFPNRPWMPDQAAPSAPIPALSFRQPLPGARRRQSNGPHHPASPAPIARTQPHAQPQPPPIG